ncbi:MAG TPA: urate oxidase [Symbiobacteriaceae bacterium]|nr:urate oxidase [Symbiobacteriaceae bacterium]
MLRHAYGKGDVTVYRTGGQLQKPLLAMNVRMVAIGEAFAEAYTAGENRAIIATDSMKNFILRTAASYDGCTMEGFLVEVGDRFLQAYPQVQSVQVEAAELPFTPAVVPAAGGVEPSPVLLVHEQGGAHSTASVELDRTGLLHQSCGLRSLQLVKLVGNSFAGFIRDEYTTLPEAHDRALFIYLEIGWRYAAPADCTGTNPVRYVAADQIRTAVQAIFHERENRSIQHLLHQMGSHLLERFEPLAEVSFVAQNRTWETAAVSAEEPTIKVYTDPRPPYGEIHLTLSRQ